MSGMMRRIAAVCVALMMFGLCGAAAAEQVVTSFYPMYVFTLNLCKGIDGLTVRNMAQQPGGCLHDYQLQTGDMKALARADAFIICGAGMESFMDAIVDALPELYVITASDGIALLNQEGEFIQGDIPQDEQVNAHVWLDVSNAKVMVSNICAGLSSKWPQYAERLQENCDAYLQQLDQLDETLRTELTDCTRKDIVTFHEAFPYFAKAYGLNVAAAIVEEPDSTLSPAELSRMISLVKDIGTPPLFTQPQYSALSANTIAQETGAEVYELDPVVTGPIDPEQALTRYETAMLENLRVLKLALRTE